MRRLDPHVHYRPLWRLAHWFRQRERFGLAYRTERLFRLVHGGDVSAGANLTDEVVLMHNALGTVIHADTRFRGRAIVFHGVTLGDDGRPRPRGPVAPTIGDRVFIGTGAAILGPIDIGDDVVVGAGTVVTKNVPARSRVTSAGVVPLDSESLLEDWMGPRRS
jgi:serine O-acetyltransferase